MHTTFPRTRWDNPLRPKAYAPFQGHTYIAAHLPYTRTARGNTLTSKPSHPGRQGFLLSLRGQWNTPRPGAPSISASGSRPNVPPHPATRKSAGWWATISRKWRAPATRALHFGGETT